MDYHNSYYGRLAVARLKETRGGAVTPTLQRLAPAPVTIPTAGRIATLLSVGLNREAMGELQYAQRIWGDSPQLQATSAWLRHQQAPSLTATDRFNALRGGINTMRRAYPHFMAAGGERLPPDVLRVIFPLDYWPLIRKYADAHDLDPFLMAALVAQESTFTPEIRSAANAYGLMQVIPKFHLEKLLDHGGEEALLTPEVNILVGAQILREYQRRFRDTETALQMYAGALDEPTAQYAGKVLAEKARLEARVQPLRREARRQQSA